MGVGCMRILERFVAVGGGLVRDKAYIRSRPDLSRHEYLHSFVYISISAVMAT